MHTKESLLKDLRTMGVDPRGTLLVHSSMKSIGSVEGGADTVLDALMEYMQYGLLVMPTHTWRQMNAKNNVFHAATEPSCVGLLTEMFRQRPGVYRSLHPTHSVAAYGRDAAEYVAGEELARTPCPRTGCWGKLLDRGAQILFIGCSLKHNTFLHGVEEWNEIPDRIATEPTLFISVDADGNRYEIPQYRHSCSNPRIEPSENYDKMESVFRAEDALHYGIFGDARCALCDARKMEAITTAALREDPDLFSDENMTLRARMAMGRVSLKGLFTEVWRWGTELYVRILYLSNGETESLICAVDSADTYVRDARRFREMVSEETKIPADHIWYHELQLHAAPASRHLTGESMEKIARAVAEEANRLKEKAVPFTCEVTEADFGRRFSVNREQYVEGLGGVTVWSGLSFDEEGKAYTQDPDIMLLRGYEPELPVFDKPIYFDNPVDPRAYLFVFKSDAGEVLGTLSRFAAHPDVAVLQELNGVLDDYAYDYDWPGTLSTDLEEHFGAPSMYLNGPCGNLCTKKHKAGVITYDQAAQQCREIGHAMAAELLRQRADHKPEDLGDTDRMKADYFEIRLPMRDELLPHSVEEAHARQEEITEAAEKAFTEAIAKGAPAYAIKRLADERWRATRWSYYVDDITGFADEDLESRGFGVSVPILRLGDYLFIGVPGECLYATTEFLRGSLTGVKTIPVDQVNGYYNYMATPTTLTLGGYTYWSSWVTRESLPMLHEAIVERIRNWE